MTEEQFENAVHRLTLYLQTEYNHHQYELFDHAANVSNQIRGFERCLFEIFGEEEKDRVVNAAEASVNRTQETC